MGRWQQYGDKEMNTKDKSLQLPQAINNTSTFLKKTIPNPDFYASYSIILR